VELSGLEPLTSAMCLNSSPDLLFSYLSRLESKGLSEQYTEKIDEYIGKYLRAFKEVSIQSVETFLHRSVHLMPRTRARYSTYLRGFLGYYGIQFDIRVKIPRSLPPYISEAEIRKLYQTIYNSWMGTGDIRPRMILGYCPWSIQSNRIVEYLSDQQIAQVFINSRPLYH